MISFSKTDKFHDEYFRCVINHEVIDCFDTIREKRKIRQGLLTRDMFKRLCDRGGKGGEEENLRNYILALNLAVELNDGEIFIPSIVANDNKVH